MEEEARKRAEWEQNGRIYLDWEDMQSDQFSENVLDRHATLSELEALDEAIDEYNATLPSIDEGQPSQPEPTPPHLVQAATEESQAPRALNPRPRPVIRPRPPSQRIAKRRKFNYPLDGTGKTPERPFSV